MLVICAAVGEPADRRRAAADLNLLARELQMGAGVSFSWEETKRRGSIRIRPFRMCLLFSGWYLH